MVVKQVIELIITKGSALEIPGRGSRELRSGRG
jgi:hypothetical protein